MGRCPVRQVFPEALALLAKKQDSFEFVAPHPSTASPRLDADVVWFSFMFENEMPLSQAVEAYQLFETRQVQKVVFTPNN
jgi:threonine dehydrogenase-like Zn-dependent dehydrogenase